MNVKDGKVIYDGKYEVEFDAEYLFGLIGNLGIKDNGAADVFAETVVCYAAEPVHNVYKVYDYVAKKRGIAKFAVGMRIKRAIDTAEQNGQLKFIDCYIPGTYYDYDYGYTNKELITIVKDYLVDTGRVRVKKLQKK